MCHCRCLLCLALKQPSIITEHTVLLQFDMHPAE
jgi:hypothetical protein